MEKEPLISIIIPFYNSERYIERCVRSIASQSYEQIEIILVNDGSQDASAAAADRLAAADSRIVRVDLPHGGVSVARNEGLRRASGGYIMFADSDDWIEKGILERMMGLMQEQDADMVTCDIRRAEKPAEYPPPQNLQYTICSREEYLRLFFKIDSNEWVHFPVAKLYKKELLPQPLYPAEIRVGEDVLGTYLAIAQSEKIIRLREPGYYYFTNPEGATSRFSGRDFDLIRVWDQVEQVTEGKEPDHAYARLNRNRINFTLLFRMITELSAREIRENYRDRQQMLRKQLRACEKELLHSPIILSRKILIILLCHFFPAAAFVGSLFVKIRRSRGQAAGFSHRRLS